MSAADLELLRQKIANSICNHLEPMCSKEMMLTLVVRHPTNSECFIVVSSDNDAEAVATLLAGARS